jgi:hypothetical protein
MPAPYATADELAAAVRVTVTAKNQAQLEACVAAASEEIDHDLDRADPLPDPPPALIHEVCVARGVEWWKANDSAFGVIGFDNTGVLNTPRDGFARHSADLIPYHQQYGIA